MSATNAPMPDASGPAEAFDSTIAPPSGNVSTIGIHVPNATEGATHSGAANGIDPTLYEQFIANGTFIWSVADEPGKCLWKIPIHPANAHQFSDHLQKMYNCWSGGFDFGVKIAGTGFHAGALMIARIPPNIDPNNLQTIQAVTAFEYAVFDPKMLEVQIKSVMDQRNIMYHYFPFDINNRESFGGYLAFYVMLPLATSSTGATEISILITAKMSADFRFFQLKPIASDVVPVAVPRDLEDSLDFTKPKTSAIKLQSISSIVVNPPSSMRYIDKETVNCLQFSQDPMNGYFIPRPETIQSFETTGKEVFSYGIKWTVTDAGAATLSFDQDNPLLAFTDLKFVNSKVLLPNITGSGAMLFNLTLKNKKKVNIVFDGEFSPVDPTTDPNVKEYKTKFVVDLTNFSWGIEIYKGFVPDGMVNGQSFWSGVDKGFLQFTGIDFGANVSYGFDLVKYSPPIEESFITFEGYDSVCAQTAEFAAALNNEAYSGFMDKQTALVFELVDTIVGLPILPIKLHYAGYFTTFAHKTEVTYRVTDPFRYKMRYIQKTGASTPLTAGKSLQQYVQNMAISRMVE